MSFAAVLERLTRLDNPYPGLRPFDTGESHLFFGRDQQVLDLLDRLARNRFVAVLGLSGSGKSSLVRAGLIPALHRGRLLEPGLSWRAVVAKPAGAPFANLADALGCPIPDLRANSHALIGYARSRLEEDEGLLVVVDQFEELFRYKDQRVASASQNAGHDDQASEAAAFIELLLAAARGPLPVYIVITMRTDYSG
jgi:energy-coupling factor transporter ATP-binding protein EcfA2